MDSYERTRRIERERQRVEKQLRASLRGLTRRQRREAFERAARGRAA